MMREHLVPFFLVIFQLFLVRFYLVLLDLQKSSLDTTLSRFSVSVISGEI